MAQARRAFRTHRTLGLVLSRRDFAEADVIITFYTEAIGKVSAVARSARRSTKRFGGSLEPMHELTVVLEETETGDLLRLRDSKIETAHTRLIARLDCIQAAGTALRWVRQCTPARTPEPALYRSLSALLTRLNEVEPHPKPATQLAEFGVHLLSSLGWGVDLRRCILCGTACPAGKAATADPARGGLICHRCGGGLLHLPGPLRGRLIDSAAGKRALLDEDADLALELVEHSLMGHVGQSG